MLIIIIIIMFTLSGFSFFCCHIYPSNITSQSTIIAAMNNAVHAISGAKLTLSRGEDQKGLTNL